METIKNYCKIHKLKFEKSTNNGFIASRLIPVKAGMSINLYTCEVISYEIKQIGKKRIYRNFTYMPDGDIVDNGIYNNN